MIQLFYFALKIVLVIPYPLHFHMLGLAFQFLLKPFWLLIEIALNLYRSVWEELTF